MWADFGVTIASTHSSFVRRVWTWGLTSRLQTRQPPYIADRINYPYVKVDFEVTNASTPTHSKENNSQKKGTDLGADYHSKF